VTNLAVEHIQHKDRFPTLKGRWTNFLLGCVNCNSCKGVKEVDFAKVFFPDRDNTFAAFLYTPDGKVAPAPTLNPHHHRLACASLSMTGLDKDPAKTPDANGKLISLDRGSQRMEVWAIAEEAHRDVKAEPGNDVLKDCVVKLARAQGYFSIWMTVFEGDTELRNRFIDAFEGTRASGCFDPFTTAAISPQIRTHCLTEENYDSARHLLRPRQPDERHRA
jgi:hypothetical protein